MTTKSTPSSRRASFSAISSKDRYNLSLRHAEVFSGDERVFMGFRKTSGDQAGPAVEVERLAVNVPDESPLAASDHAVKQLSRRLLRIVHDGLVSPR